MTDTNGNYKVKDKPTAKMIGVVSFTNGIMEEAIYGTRGYSGAIVVTTKKQNR